MGTMIGTETTMEKMLENLLEYEYDIVEAYKAAKERLTLPSETEMLTSFETEHLEQIRNLAKIVQPMRGRTPREGDWRQLFTEGKVVIAGLVGELAVLTAMTHNERNVLNVYERAFKRYELPDGIRAVLMLHSNRAQSRYTWLSDRVETLTS